MWRRVVVTDQSLGPTWEMNRISGVPHDPLIKYSNDYYYKVVSFIGYITWHIQQCIPSNQTECRGKIYLYLYIYSRNCNPVSIIIRF